MSDTPAASAEPERSGVRAGVRPELRTVALRLSGAAAIVAADLWSKSAVFAWVQRLDAAGDLVLDHCGSAHRRFPILGEWLTFMLSLNPGAAFGQLDSIPYVLVLGRLGASLFLIWLLWRTPCGRGTFTFALVLVLGGAAGNLYDNLLRARDLVQDRFYPAHLIAPGRTYPFGPVRDFIDVYFEAWKWHFPTFNVADSCITVGAVLLLLQGLLGHRRAA